MGEDRVLAVAGVVLLVAMTVSALVGDLVAGGLGLRWGFIGGLVLGLVAVAMLVDRHEKSLDEDRPPSDTRGA